MGSCYYVDVEGFYSDSGEYIVKELAWINLHMQEDQRCVVFSPPQNIRRPATVYLSTLEHGLFWEDEGLPYEQLKKELLFLKSALNVFCNNLNKCEFLSTLLDGLIVSLTPPAPPPPTPDRTFECQHPFIEDRCALYRALYYYKQNICLDV